MGQTRTDEFRKDAVRIAFQLNTRPRKTLGFQTPADTGS